MNDSRSTNPKIRVLTGVTGACAAVIAIVVLVYALTMPPSPEEAAESYIEDHYDAVAEAVVHSALPDSPLNVEVIAEVAESISEQVIPYECEVSNDYETTVDTRCDLSFALDWPLELRIYAPFRVTMIMTDRDFLGRPTPVVQDANPIINEMAVNGISIDGLTGAESKAQEVKEALDNFGSNILNLPTGVIPAGQPTETDTARPFGTPDVTKQTTPTPVPREIAEAGVCGRTPEVQNTFIGMLGIPSCRTIDAAELYRVREFSASAQSFKVGDFDHLPNLLVLGLRLNEDHKDRPIELGPGIFEDLQSLAALEIKTDSSKPTIRLTRDTFKGLESLENLDIRYVESLPDESLDYLKNLRKLQISYLKGDIPSRVLDQLHKAESISISAYKGETSNPRTIPTDFLKNLPKLRQVGISSEYLPERMEVNSYETACLVEDWGLQDREGNRVSMTVDSKIVEVTNRTTDRDPINERDVRICQLNVGDTETKRIIIPLE